MGPVAQSPFEPALKRRRDGGIRHRGGRHGDVRRQREPQVPVLELN